MLTHNLVGYLPEGGLGEKGLGDQKKVGMRKRFKIG
jgi:hypothetical protein